jgi:hypothetical protein
MHGLCDEGYSKRRDDLVVITAVSEAGGACALGKSSSGTQVLAPTTFESYTPDELWVVDAAGVGARRGVG